MITKTKTTWRTVRLGEAVEIIDGDRGKNYPGNGELLVSGYSVFLNTKNVSGTKFDFSNGQFISEKRDRLLRKGKLERGDFVLTTRGTIGNVAYYGKDIQYDHIRINSGMVILRPKQNIIDVRFLNLFLVGQAFKNQTISLQSGSAQPQLPIRDLQRFEIDLPPIKEQSKISDILWPFDEKIENNNLLIKTLEEMAQTVFKEWFVNFHFPGFEKVEFVDSELGRIPKGWEIKTLKDIVSNISDRYDGDNKIDRLPYIPIETISSKNLALINAANFEEAQTSLIKFHKNDILFGAMRPYFHKVTVAPFDGLTRTTCFVFRPLNQSYWGFVAMLLFSNNAVDYATGHAQGTTIPYAKWGVSFADMPVIKPTQEIAEKYNDFFQTIISKIQSLAIENQKLAALRDLLLPRLMSGEIKI